MSRVTFIVQNHIIGTEHHFFGWHLVGDAGHELFLPYPVAQTEPTQTFRKVEIDTHHAVHQTVKTAVVKDGALKKDIGELKMQAAETVEIGHHPRVNQSVETVQESTVGKDAFGDGTLVGTSVGQENPVAQKMPQVVKEALACGCPIVSVDVGDVKERIEGVNNCYLVPREPRAIREAIRKVTAERTNGQEKIIADGLTNEQVANKIMDVYARVMR